jgi:hypothetical protein
MARKKKEVIENKEIVETEKVENVEVKEVKKNDLKNIPSRYHKFLKEKE